MAQFVAFDSAVDVSGRAVLSVIDGMGIFETKAREILARHGIVDPQPDKWYPQQAWLDAFRTIAESLGPKTLFEIGKKIPENAAWPEGVDDIKSALRSIDKAYQMNHRFGEIGSYNYYDLDENQVRMICNNPYPCKFDHGIITAVADKFKPAGTFMVEVEHDHTLPCRDDGADICSYIVRW